MLRYTLTRLALVMPLLLLLSFVVFIYIHLIPGDPVQAMVGSSASTEFVAQLRHEFGLDRPLMVQYADWLGKAVRGDLGISFRSRQPIAPLLLARVPATLELALCSLILGLLMGLTAGIIAGIKKNTVIDHVFSLLSLIGYSMPLFWTGTLLLLLLGVKLRVLPSSGYVPITTDAVENLKHLAMPTMALGIGLAPYLARMSRAAVIETLQEPFIAYARTKGLKQVTFYVRYVLRHAITSIAVVLGLDIGYLLGGQIVIEELFGYPGAGRVIVRAILERDYFVVQASILVYAGLFLLLNFAVELLHAWLDPRVQLAHEEHGAKP